MLDLISAWRDFDSTRPPYLLGGDAELLERGRSVTFGSREEFISHPDFDFSRDKTLHLGLLPVPFAGDLRRADIFILLQNPGFRPSDYFAELDRPELTHAPP